MYVFVKDPMSNTYVKAQVPSVSTDQSLTLKPSYFTQEEAFSETILVAPAAGDVAKTVVGPAAAPTRLGFASFIPGWLKP